jgi:hypothetical protein
MKYCEDCKWLGNSLSDCELCTRRVKTPVSRETVLNQYAREQRASGDPEACGESGKYWEEYIPPKTFWQKLGVILNQG